MNRFRILLKICYRRIIRKKARTLLNIIILSTSLVLLIGYGSIARTFLNALNDFNYLTFSGIKANGYFKVENENRELLKKISQNLDLNVGIKKGAKEIEIDDPNFDSNYNDFISINGHYLDSSAISLEKGKLPKKTNEIVLPEKYKRYYNSEIQIHFLRNHVGETKTFKVKGIYRVLNGNNNFRSLLVAEDFFNSNIPTYSEYYISGSNIDLNAMNQLASKEKCEFVENPYQGMKVNLYLLGIIFLLALIVFVVIRNINEIYRHLDWEENKKLKFVGLNNFNLLLLNGLYSIILIIPSLLIGVPIGIFLYYWIMPVILSFTKFSSLGTPSISFLQIFFSVLGVLVIYFVTLSFGGKSKPRKIKKVRKLTLKNKSIENSYSSRAIQMNKKKYISIIFSLVVTISMFVIILTVSFSIDPFKHAQNNNIYDAEVTGLLSENGMDKLPISPINELNNYDITYEQNSLLLQETETGIQSFVEVEVDKQIQVNTDELDKIIEVEKNRYLTTVTGMGEKYFEYIENKYDVTGAGYSTKGLMYYRGKDVEDDIELGDTIHLTLSMNDGQEKKITTTVETIITDKEKSDNNDPYLGVLNFSNSYFEENFGLDYISSIGIMSKDDDEINKLVEDLGTNEKLDWRTSASFQETLQQFRMFLVSFGIFGAVLLLINSLLNIACTQISNCRSRNKELATLQAIGCSKERIITILLNETSYYIVRSLSSSMLIQVVVLYYVKMEIAFSDHWLLIYLLISILTSLSVYLVNRFIIVKSYQGIAKESITSRIL